MITTVTAFQPYAMHPSLRLEREVAEFIHARWMDMKEKEVGGLVSTRRNEYNFHRVRLPQSLHT